MTYLPRTKGPSIFGAGTFYFWVRDGDQVVPLRYNRQATIIQLKNYYRLTTTIITNSNPQDFKFSKEQKSVYALKTE